MFSAPPRRTRQFRVYFNTYKLIKELIMPKSTNQHPGAVFKALLDEYQLTPARAAAEIKLNQSSVRLLTLQKMKVSAPIALRLAKYFSTTVEYWLDLQTKYDLAEAAKDKELSGIIKGIQKAKKADPAKKPAKKAAGRPAKAAAAKKPAKADAPKKAAAKKAPGRPAKAVTPRKSAKADVAPGTAPRRGRPRKVVTPPPEPREEPFKPEVILIKQPQPVEEHPATLWNSPDDESTQGSNES
jgi:addiction module HigA family antidote